MGSDAYGALAGRGRGGFSHQWLRHVCGYKEAVRRAEESSSPADFKLTHYPIAERRGGAKGSPGVAHCWSTSRPGRRSPQSRAIHLRISAMTAPSAKLAPRNHLVGGNPMRPMT